MIEKKPNSGLKIGLFGIGLQAYWDQFQGLEQRLTGYVDLVGDKLKGYGAQVINLGLVDTPEKAFDSGREARYVSVTEFRG